MDRRDTATGNQQYIFFLRFINVYTNPSHKPAPFRNAENISDALNIAVQRAKKDAHAQ